MAASSDATPFRAPPVRIVPLLASFAAVALSTTIAYAVDERPVVSEVVIEGTKRIHPDRIRFIIATRAGQPLDYVGLADDVRAIETLGPFTGVRVEQVEERATNRVKVVFRVTELPYVGAIRFANLNYFQRSGLEKQILTKVGQYLNPLVLENDRHALERYYRDKGYSDARVTTETPFENEIATVVFTVDFGRQVEVGKVLYQGLPAGVLTRTMDVALINAPGAPYQPEMVALDEQAAARTLQDLGWLDATVAPAERLRFDYVRPLEERRRHGPLIVPDGRYDDRVVLAMAVTPGEVWRLGDVAFLGNTVASEEELRRAFALPAGAVFRRKDIDNAVDQAERVVRNQGYARAALRVDRRPDPATRVMHLTLHLFEGDQYTLDRVDVHGNFRTKDAVVRRALRLHPGELWNEDRLDQSKSQIQRIGLFKSQPPRGVRLAPRFDEDRPGRVDLVTDVEEDSTGNFRVQLGFSSSSGVFGELGYQERNFDLIKAVTLQGWRGAGHVLELNASGSEDRTSAGISWTNPHLWDGPYSLSVAFNRSDSSRLDWDERRTASSVGVGRAFLDNDLRLNLTYTYTDLRIGDVDQDAPDDALDGEGDYFLNTLTFRQSYDRLNHPRLPTRGYRLSFTEGLTGEPLSATTDYFEWSAKGDAFIPFHTFDLGGTVYLHLSERWQQLHAISDTERVPFYERYYGGGPTPRHRGFGSGRLSPRATNRNGTEARIGGTTDTIATAELSIPLQGEDDKIRLVLFADYGDVYAEGESVDPLNMRTAAGFGIRFPVQIPIALDFAWLIDAKSGESDNQIHFNLGFFSF